MKISIAKSLVWLAVLMVCPLANAGESGPPREGGRGPRELMQQIESPGFSADTAIASGHNVVESVIRKTPQFVELSKAGEELSPVLRERAGALAAGGPGRRMPLIAYVLLFKARKDRAAVPLLARCLRGLPESERVASLTPFAPFCYILDALKELSNGAIEIPVPAEAFADRARIADRAERWYGRHR